MSAKGTGSRTNWSFTHVENINNWNECASSKVIHPARPYDHSSYGEYLSWYVARTRSTLLSEPFQGGHIPYHEECACDVHILVSAMVYSILFNTYYFDTTDMDDIYTGSGGV